MPPVKPGDMDIIAQPLDFYGVNIYTGTRIRAGANGEPEPAGDPTGGPRTAYNWTVSPELLYWGPRFLWERYKTPIIITENGMANVDWVGLDGKVHDPQRMDYLRRYLSELRRAISDGVDVRGYFYWSILTISSGRWLTSSALASSHVDYSTQVRTPKDSFYLYQRIIKENRVIGTTGLDQAPIDRLCISVSLWLYYVSEEAMKLLSAPFEYTGKQAVGALVGDQMPPANFSQSGFPVLMRQFIRAAPGYLSQS